MEKNKSIPQGYMTVGQVAKKMGVTVRTLQYYDNEELLCPSAESEGGRRLYNDKDLVKLHQILSLKSLGFSLEDIRNCLFTLDTPSDVAAALTGQAEKLRRQIASLSKSLDEIEKLKVEVLQMKTVNFKKYADIIVNLQMNNEYYFLLDQFDDNTLDHIRKRFNEESAMAFINRFNHISDAIILLAKEQVPPENERCQTLTKAFWEMIMDFTDGDMSLLPILHKLGNVSNSSNSWQEKQAMINEYLQPAMEIYFTGLGINPFEEGTT